MSPSNDDLRYMLMNLRSAYDRTTQGHWDYDQFTEMITVGGDVEKPVADFGDWRMTDADGQFTVLAHNHIAEIIDALDGRIAFERRGTLHVPDRLEEVLKRVVELAHKHQQSEDATFADPATIELANRAIWLADCLRVMLSRDHEIARRLWMAGRSRPDMPDIGMIPTACEGSYGSGYVQGRSDTIDICDRDGFLDFDPKPEDKLK